ncbi:MAG: TonB C-terminal domain-containing protein [Vicinamibacterales bacterium]
MDDVSAVLSARIREDDGLKKMMGYSVAAHAVFLGAIIFMGVGAPGPEPEVVMQISLGAGSLPRDGGLATLGGRPIQQTIPVEAKRTIEPVRPPAAREPEMIEPTKAPPKRTPPPEQNPAKDPASRTPTRGKEVQAGSTVAETGAKGQGFGLSSGGGGSSGYLDVANFCCPEYLTTMLDLVNRNWDYKQRTDGSTQIRFVIQRDGRIVDVNIERPSGVAALDYLASRSVQLTRLPPLPAPYTESALTVHLVFDYKR